MPTRPKFGNVVLCEHVIPGGGNKHSLINVFAGDLLLPQFPAKLGLGFYAEYYPKDASDGKMTLELRINKKTFARIEVAFERYREGAPGIIAISFFELNVEQETQLEIFSRPVTGKAALILRKNILMAPSSALPSVGSDSNRKKKSSDASFK